jgi:hypothetical protein
VLLSEHSSTQTASAGLRANQLADSGKTLDLFVTREAAQAELREILVDEPGWVDVLHVESIQLDEQNVSPN